MTLRLGILACDAVDPDLRPHFGDYPDMFRTLLSEGIARLECRMYDLTARHFPDTLDECDAWLFTGSRWSVYDSDEWIAQAHALARALHQRRYPTIAVCFGHQLVASALGGKVGKADAGWGVGVHTTHIHKSPPWMIPKRDTLSLLVSHQDQVLILPREADPLAGHAFCRYDISQVGDHILTFQGHPEFPRGYSRATMEKRRALLGDDTYQKGIASLASPIQPNVVASWCREFLQRAMGWRYYN